MGRSPCCDKVGLKKGPWTPEEDQKLLAYIEEHGHGSWRALPAKAGLQRCGKSCRLRWTNYLRPDIKRGKFSLQEEQTIIQLHALLGNRWSAIATHLPKRTDNEIKNYWNTHLKKRLAKMGIDPVTHKPKNDALLSIDGQSKSAANLSHMAQWESARLEAEARLVRESKLRSHSLQQQQQQHHIPPSTSTSPPLLLSSNKPEIPSRSLDVLKAWSSSSNNNNWVKSTDQPHNNIDLESPSSSLTFSENNAPPIMNTNTAMPMIEFVGTTTTSANSSETGVVKEEAAHHHDHQDWKMHLPEYKDAIDINSMSSPFVSTLHELTISMEGTNWTTASESLRTTTDDVIAEEGFTNLLLNTNSDDRSLSEEGGGESNNCDGGGDGGGGGSDFYEDNKNYWNSILNLVNSSPSDSPMF